MQVFFSAAIDICFAIVLGFVLINNKLDAETIKIGQKISKAAALALGIAVITFLLLGTIQITDTDLAGLIKSVFLVIKLTAFGNMAALALIAWLIICILLFSNANKIFIWASLAVFAYAKAAIGHAADLGVFHILVAVHTIHILAASAWVGSALASILIVRQWAQFSHQRSHDLAQWLSSIATIAVPLTLIAGGADTVRILYESNNYWGSAYVITLGLKISLVLIAIILGLINRWVWMNKIDAGAAYSFIQTIKIEAIALFITLIAAAKLGSTMIPS